MRVSVIIPVFNDPRIETCILSVLTQDYPKDLYEVIVVDNNSDDATAEIIQRFNVKYVEEDRKGSYFARNKGIEIATGDVAAFIDADCIADPHWLRELIKGFNDLNVGGIGGRILKSKPQTWVQVHSEDLAEQQLAPQYLPFHDAPYIVTANAAYRMSLLRSLKGFDARFQSGGDVDLSWRVHAAGFTIITDPDAIVYHAARETVKSYFKQFFTYAAWHVFLFKKYSQHTNFFANTYPFTGICRLLFSVIPIMVMQKLSGKTRTVKKRKMYIELVKYLAIICGNLYGAMKYHVFYF